MYSAAKAAAWSLTNSLRVELAAQGTLVVGVHVGFMDTDMAAGVEAPKVSPDSVVEATLGGAACGPPRGARRRRQPIRQVAAGRRSRRPLPALVAS